MNIISIFIWRNVTQGRQINAKLYFKVFLIYFLLLVFISKIVLVFNSFLVK